MTIIEIFRLLLDAGLLVLIWLVQLVIYPGFQYYNKADLIKWHKQYTSRITYVVLPLMLGQLSLCGIQLWSEVNRYSLGSFLIIGLLWALTFLWFIPLHHKISEETFDDKTLTSLVKTNWLRTALWTILFGWSFFEWVLALR